MMILILTISLAGCQKKVVQSNVTAYDNVKQQVKEAPVLNDTIGYPSPDEPEAPKTEKPDPSPIYFDFDKSNLSDEAQLILVKIAKYMIDAPENVYITGHCDERGSDDYNNALGQRRAEAAKGWLTANGVPKEKVKTRSLGKQWPIIRGCENETCHEKNRRDEFKIIPSDCTYIDTVFTDSLYDANTKRM